MAKNNRMKKQVRDTKSTPPPQSTLEIEPGNVPILTVRLLDTINKNLITLVQQNAKLISMLEHVEEGSDG